MTTLRQAAQAVLERWDSPSWSWSVKNSTADLMAALRTALAQPEQRPWVGLTDEEVQFCALKHRQLVNAYYDAAKDTTVITAAFEATVFYKEISAVLKERNHD